MKKITVLITILLLSALLFDGCSVKSPSTVEQIPVLEPADSKSTSWPIIEDADENTQKPSPNNPCEVTVKSPMDEFYIKEIDDVIFARMRDKSYKTDCPIPLEDLRYVHILHKNLNNETLEGELIVNAHIAEDVLEIFKELYNVSYPIERVTLVDEYGGDDELSMEGNNSSAFNYRSMTGSTKISKHGLGMAIDINPLFNPYVKEASKGTVIEPVTAVKYANRESKFDYKITKDDDLYRIFTNHGFEWGGSWTSCKDYQHFEVPTSAIRSIYSWY